MYTIDIDCPLMRAQSDDAEIRVWDADGTHIITVGAVRQTPIECIQAVLLDGRERVARVDTNDTIPHPGW